MGREIRKVPPGWAHPRDKDGDYMPLFDQTYEEALKVYVEDPEEWSFEMPDPELYRPAYDAEPTHFQIYETVSEGTPVSPVFASLAELQAWLVEQGYSAYAAARFAETGHAASMFVFLDVGDRVGYYGLDIESYDLELLEEAK